MRKEKQRRKMPFPMLISRLRRQPFRSTTLESKKIQNKRKSHGTEITGREGSSKGDIQIQSDSKTSVFRKPQCSHEKAMSRTCRIMYHAFNHFQLDHFLMIVHVKNVILNCICSSILPPSHSLTYLDLTIHKCQKYFHAFIQGILVANSFFRSIRFRPKLIYHLITFINIHPSRYRILPKDKYVGSVNPWFNVYRDNCPDLLPLKTAINIDTPRRNGECG